MTLLAIVCIVGIALQVADYATTRLILEKRVGYERNPLVVGIMRAVSALTGDASIRPGLVLVKLAGIVLFVAFAYGEVDWRLVAALDLFMLAIVLNNLAILRRSE